MKIVNRSDFKHKQLVSAKTGEAYSFSSVVSESFGSKQVFLTHDIIAPNTRTAAAHRHSYIEEIVFVSKGQLTVMWGDQKRIASEGSFIFFDPKETELHCLLNETNDEVETITFSIKRQDDVVIYENSKI